MRPQQPFRKSFQDTAVDLRLAGNDLKAAADAIAALSRHPPQFGKHGEKLVRVYVQGIVRMPIKKIKKNLRDLRFRTSCIPRISFLGSATSEFLIAGNYVSGFKNRIAVIGQSAGWKILDNYNAAVAADPRADAATKKRVEAAFLERVHSIIRSSENRAVKASYSTWLTSLGLPLPSEQPSMPAVSTSVASTSAAPVPTASTSAAPTSSAPAVNPVQMDVDHSKSPSHAPEVSS